MQPRYAESQNRLRVGIFAGDAEAITQGVAELKEYSTEDPIVFVGEASLLLSKGDLVGALDCLEKAVSTGFREVPELAGTETFSPLKEDSRFRNLIAATRMRIPYVPGAPEGVGQSIQEVRARIDAQSAYWDFAAGVFRTVHTEWPVSEPIFGSEENLASLFTDWKGQGTLAGNAGDLYDNYDLAQSSLRSEFFPGLCRTEYSAPWKERGLAHGLQLRFLHNTVVVGNSSMASEDPWIWRSQPRLAYTSRVMVEQLAKQYRSNHLYVYPEHRDYDPGHNGIPEPAKEGTEAVPGGYGDVYPAMTPYLLISQGSSGSDQAFVEALFWTLAAFRPEVKEELKRTGLLMPTLQKILRQTYRAGSENSYLEGISHPPVFEGEKLDLVA
ncbi:MAG: hypothetical protein AAF491_03565, partial [Verrucomicrobiota bacterium]